MSRRRRLIRHGRHRTTTGPGRHHAVLHQSGEILLATLTPMQPQPLRKQPGGGPRSPAWETTTRTMRTEQEEWKEIAAQPSSPGPSIPTRPALALAPALARGRTSALVATAMMSTAGRRSGACTGHSESGRTRRMRIFAGPSGEWRCSATPIRCKLSRVSASFPDSPTASRSFPNNSRPPQVVYHLLSPSIP